MEVQENLQLVTIQDHPIHGSFDVEVPETFSDDQVRNHVDGLDLDLLLGFKDQQTLGETDVKNIQEWENSTGAGKRNGLWFSHASLEGGTDTIAYGHKLTSEEVETGVIKVGENSYNWREGLTQEAADSILNQDAGAAKGVALASLTKAGLEDNQGAIQALTSLIYNVGSGAWGKSKAKKFLEAGQVEDFLHEAFDPEIGFVKINGEVSRGLARRRSEEAELFASNIDKGSKFGKMVSEFVTALNPISSASAAEFTPPTLYTVQSGDTLSKIAKDNGISLNGLVKLNPQIKDINKIGIGDQINLTPPSAEPQESSILSNLNPISSANAAVIEPTKIKKTSTSFWQDFKDTVDVIPSNWQVYANHILGETGVITESILNKKEKAFMKDIALKGIKQGKTGVSYTSKKGSTNIAYKGGSKGIGYQSKINLFPTDVDVLRTTVGKADLVVHNNNVMMVDEYDMPMDKGVLKQLKTTEKKLRNSSLNEKLDYIMGASGSQGKAHRFGELFAAQEGHALSQRYTLGTLEELGLTPKDVSHLSTLEDYEQEKVSQGKMNPDNMMTKF